MSDTLPARAPSKKMLKIFNQLLIYTNGDANQALQWMTEMDRQYGLGDDEIGMGEFIEWLKREGYLEDAAERGEFQITGKTTKKIREDSLNEIFSTLRKQSAFGNHKIPRTGQSDERMPETRPWRFGDNLQNLDLTATINNALKRSIDDIVLSEEDFRIYETEHQTTCATVLIIDISHSMILYGEDRITPAKKVAMALAELILTRYPKDSLDIILFGDEAWTVDVKDLPFVSVGPYHTNTKAGLALARQILKRKKNQNKQIFMITDGKPSAINEGAKIYKNSFGLDRKIVNKTLNEAVICRKDKITITTFMVTSDPYLQGFVRELTEANRGRAYFSGLDNLGEYLFINYIRNRRKKLR
ncbi:MAG: VWA domain-containing protein [Chloroherpetonaceae bacterium]|nr:VWA domain-containing protein [Chloroherpetonaceae bacterium]